MNMDSIKTQLMDMGFNEAKVKIALESCPEAQTLEQVMEWLIAHEDELDKPSTTTTTTTSNKTQNDQSERKQIPAGTDANDSNGNESSTQDNDKDRDNKGNNEETAVNMAARKKITVQEAQQLINERQIKRAEEDRKREIENEKRRRQDGQKILETRQELQDRERILLAQQIRREKIEKELHRKQVLEQIKMDRQKIAENRAGLLAGESSVKRTPTATKGEPSSSSSSSRSTSNPASECRVALRFPDGSNLVHKFSPKEQLSAVRTFVQTEKNSSLAKIEFVAPPNKKLTEADMESSLEALGLCPASRLEVRYTQPILTDLD